ncbi:hypothetical protein MVEN_00002300 [Mycena venus]|uniref:Uncharacterized protein n=1 Tax=Mycena venus TaxID=2733690 RepID=A0A8H6Z5Z6_9AGAR|nr:hypothetical protein MVEN_00002300 [Mycena venus]
MRARVHALSPAPVPPTAGPSRHTEEASEPSSKRIRRDTHPPPSRELPASQLRGQPSSGVKPTAPPSSKPAAAASTTRPHYTQHFQQRAESVEVSEPSDVALGKRKQRPDSPPPQPPPQPLPKSTVYNDISKPKDNRPTARPTYRGAPATPITPTPAAGPSPSTAADPLIPDVAADSPAASDKLEVGPMSRLEMLEQQNTYPPGPWANADAWPYPAYQRVNTVFARDSHIPTLYSKSPFRCTSCISKNNPRCGFQGFLKPCMTCQGLKHKCSFSYPATMLQVMDDIRPMVTMTPDAALNQALIALMNARRDVDFFFRLFAQNAAAFGAALEDLVLVFANQEELLPDFMFAEYFENDDDRMGVIL